MPAVQKALQGLLERRGKKEKAKPLGIIAGASVLRSSPRWLVNTCVCQACKLSSQHVPGCFVSDFCIAFWCLLLEMEVIIRYTKHTAAHVAGILSC